MLFFICCSSLVNKSVVADGPSVPAQSSSGFQHGWSGTPGQLSMADIVKMGRPQVKQSSSKPAVTADKGYTGQYPSLPSTVNQNLKQSASTVSPTNPDQGLHSAQDSIHPKDHNHSAAVNKQAYDNDWLPQDEPPPGNQSALPETSGDQSLYESSLQSSTLLAGVINPHENSHLDENRSAAFSSESHLEHHGGDSEYDDGLLQESSTYLPQKNSHAEDEGECRYEFMNLLNFSISMFCPAGITWIFGVMSLLHSLALEKAADNLLVNTFGIPSRMPLILA